MSLVLLIFIKNPRLCFVKTRLARTAGDAEALRIYRILLEKTRQASLEVNVQRWLFYSDFIETADEWSGTQFRKLLQNGADLGLRMENAFRLAFEAGAQKALIVGSDCPALSGDVLQQAFDALDTADFALGPTPDGGYYLLGMKELESSLFRDMAWSTETVLTETLKKIREAGRTFELLPELPDVDTEADWLQFTGKTTTSRFP